MKLYFRRWAWSFQSLSIIGALVLVAYLLISVTFYDSHRPGSSDLSRSRRSADDLPADNYSDIRRLPPEVRLALEKDSVNGYLSGNASGLEFHPYASELDLRVIVFGFNRSESLNACLTALNEALYDGDRVGLHVWLDRSYPDQRVDAGCLNVSQSFNFTHGTYSVHVQASHAGVQGQWMNAWRPRSNTREIALLLEDDITVSPFFWRWLKMAHRAYAVRDDVSGFSVSHPEMEHMNGGLLEVPINYTIFMYKVICTWGYSPRANSWRAFQDWFYQTEKDKTFQPVVEGILPSKWYLSEKLKNNERTLWEQWHIYFAHARGQYTIMLNPFRRGLLAVNRHEFGLHDGHLVVGATQPLCSEWSPAFENLPAALPKFGYDGMQEKEIA